VILVRHKTAPAYNAVQWIGTNLRELQGLTFPASPVWGPGIQNPGLPSANGLVQVPMGSWVLRISDVPEFMVLSDDTFKSIFVPIEGADTHATSNSRKLN